jgi:hypothetical protein
MDATKFAISIKALQAKVMEDLEDSNTRESLKVLDDYKFEYDRLCQVFIRHTLLYNLPVN